MTLGAACYCMQAYFAGETQIIRRGVLLAGVVQQSSSRSPGEVVWDIHSMISRRNREFGLYETFQYVSRRVRI